MKNSKIIIIVLTLLFAGFFVFLAFKKDDKMASTEVPLPQTSSIVGCYVATLGKDVYTLSILSQNGESVKGHLSFKNFQKDSSSGPMEGTYRNDVLLGDYSFDSEGMHSVVQVIFKKTANGFVRGYGQMNSSGERFADLSDITYDTSAEFKTSPC